MYAAIIVKKDPEASSVAKKTHKGINAKMSYYFPFPTPRDESDYVIYNTLSSMYKQVLLSIS